MRPHRSRAAAISHRNATRQLTFVELIGATIPGSVTVITSKKWAAGQARPRCPRIHGEDPMGTKFVALATAILASLTIYAAQAAEPNIGGNSEIYHRETPPSLSIHEEATFSVNVPAMGLYNNLVMYDQHKPQNSMSTIVPDLADELGLGCERHRADFQAASRSQMARRSAVHGQGRRSAPSTCCRARRRTSSGKIRARICLATSAKSPPTATSR